MEIYVTAVIYRIIHRLSEICAIETYSKLETRGILLEFVRNCKQLRLIAFIYGMHEIR